MNNFSAKCFVSLFYILRIVRGLPRSTTWDPQPTGVLSHGDNFNHGTPTMLSTITPAPRPQDPSPGQRDLRIQRRDSSAWGYVNGDTGKQFSMHFIFLTEDLAHARHNADTDCFSLTINLPRGLLVHFTAVHALRRWCNLQLCQLLSRIILYRCTAMVFPILGPDDRRAG